MVEKIKIKLPIIVEGKYDKNTLSQIFDTAIITTGGFSVFNSKEKQALIKKLAHRGGIILLTDSDAGGRQIRTFLSKILPRDKIFNLYTPQLKGKEKRKDRASKEGFLGVEGMEREILVSVLSPFIDNGACDVSSEKTDKRLLTKMDLYRDGLSGGEGSSEKRAKLAARLGLPSDMTAKALIEAVNLVSSYEEYERILAELFEDKESSGS